MERGVSGGYSDTWRRLADALDVTVDSLIEDFSPKVSSLLTVERALSLSPETFAGEVKEAETGRLHKVLASLVGDDVPRTRGDLKAGVQGIPQNAFSLALEIRSELIGRGEKPPEEKLPVFKRRLKALHLA